MSYLDRESLGNVKNELAVGVVVVVGATGYVDAVIRHLDVLYSTMNET